MKCDTTTASRALTRRPMDSENAVQNPTEILDRKNYDRCITTTCNIRQANGAVFPIFDFQFSITLQPS
jgi:hypothetical protein